MDNPLTALHLSQLRARRSVKWQRYPSDVLPLWIAEMDTPLAPPVRDALITAVDQGDTGYAHIDRLGTAFHDFAQARLDWAPDPAAMTLLPDVLSGLRETLRTILRPGDGVVVNTPAYPPFFKVVPEAGCHLVESPLDGDGRPDLNRLADAFAAGARAYLMCNPHNPTGVVYTRAELTAIAELADRYGVRVLSDEVHAPLTYPGAVHVPFLTLDSPAAARAFAFVSASKAWNLPGLKTALAIAGPEAETLEPEIALRASLFGVLAGTAAFRSGGSWLDGLLAGLDANRRLLAQVLDQQLPAVRYRLPDATYLAWLDCRELGLGDDPAAQFLDRGRVALSPGPDFGRPGYGWVRLNLATAPEIIVEAVRRMAGTLA